MNIVITGQFLFPKGSASAARVRNFALGFRENGVGVHIVPMSQLASGEDKDAIGTATFSDGITYDRIGITNVDGRLSNRLMRKPAWMVNTYLNGVKAARAVQARITDGSCDLVIGYGESGILLGMVARSCRRANIPCICNVDELGSGFPVNGGRWNPLYWDRAFGERVIPRSFDAIMPISTGLDESYSQRGCQSSILVPAIEGWDSGCPVSAPSNKAGKFVITYVGALVARDAPAQLIGIAKELQCRKVNVSFKLVGRFQEKRAGRNVVDGIKKDVQLSKMFDFVGSVSDAGIVSYLRNTDALILPRRNALTEVCSFPTRLVEYLKQARPVIVTDVGDISKYLGHNEHAILIPPDGPNVAADRIQELIESSDRGFALGCRGYERGKKCFNRYEHARRILDFANTLKRPRIKGDHFVSRSAEILDVDCV